jgi:DNA-binding LacI/PurR family transcriptional regulator
MASLKDVAQRANVSLMTVSRAINEPERLRPETYKKVMEAVDALGMSPISQRKNSWRENHG